MENQNSQLAVIGNDGKLATVTGPQSCKDFVAGKLGLTIPKSTKEAPFTMKELVVMAKAANVSDDRIKALRKEHKAAVTAHYGLSAVFGAALMADSRFRKNLKSSYGRDKAGNRVANGWNVSIRRERSAATSQSATIALLEAQVAKLTLALTAVNPA